MSSPFACDPQWIAPSALGAAPKLAESSEVMSAPSSQRSLENTVDPQEAALESKVFRALDRRQFKRGARLLNTLAQRQEVKQDPRASASRLDQTLLLLRVGKFGRAGRAFRKIDPQQLNPKSKALYQAVGRKIAQHQRRLRKKRRIQALLTQGPKNFTAALNRADPARALKIAHAHARRVERHALDDPQQTAIAKLMLAMANLADGQTKKGLQQLESLERSTPLPRFQALARLERAKLALTNGDFKTAIPLLRALGEDDGPTREAARSALVRVDLLHLGMMHRKVKAELGKLDSSLERRESDSRLALLNPLVAIENLSGHRGNIQALHAVAVGKLQMLQMTLATTIGVMKRHDLSLLQLRKMSVKARMKFMGREPAIALSTLLGSKDIKHLLEGRLNQGAMSWERGQPYVSSDYLRTLPDEIFKHFQAPIDYARAFYRAKAKSNDVLKAKTAKAINAAFEAVDSAGLNIQTHLSQAQSFYNSPAHRARWWSTLGRAGVMGGSLLSMPVTATSTVLNDKVSPQARADALAELGLIALGAAGSKSFGLSKLDEALLVQMKRLPGASLAGRAAQAYAKTNARFQQTRLANAGDALLKLNPKYLRRVENTTPKPAHSGGSKFLGDPRANRLRRPSPRHIETQIVRPERIVTQVRPGPSAPRRVDDVVEELLSKADLRSLKKLPEGHLRDRVYQVYSRATLKVQRAERTFSQARDALRENVQRFGGGRPHVGFRGQDWLFRNSAPKFGKYTHTKPTTRFVFNVKPQEQTMIRFFRELGDRLNDAKVPFELKVPQNIEDFARLDSAVLYVNEAHASKAREVIAAFHSANPKMFNPQIPAMMQPFRSGIASARQLQGPGYTPSYGDSVSRIIADALQTAPSGATLQVIKHRVRKAFRSAGLDPSQPWRGAVPARSTKPLQ